MKLSLFLNTVLIIYEYFILRGIHMGHPSLKKQCFAKFEKLLYLKMSKTLYLEGIFTLCHSLALRTTYILNFNNILNTRPNLDPNVSFYKDPKLSVE